MATKPTKRILDWASGGTTTDPGAGKEATGWQTNDRPPANWWNWILQSFGEWLAYFETWTDDNESIHAIITTGSSSAIKYQNSGITSLSDSGNDILVNLTSSFSTVDTMVIVSSTEADGYSLGVKALDSGTITLSAEVSSSGAAVDLTSFAMDIHLLVFGER